MFLGLILLYTKTLQFIENLTQTTYTAPPYYPKYNTFRWRIPIIELMNIHLKNAIPAFPHLIWNNFHNFWARLVRIHPVKSLVMMWLPKHVQKKLKISPLSVKASWRDITCKFPDISWKGTLPKKKNGNFWEFFPNGGPPPPPLPPFGNPCFPKKSVVYFAF